MGIFDVFKNLDDSNKKGILNESLEIMKNEYQEWMSTNKYEPLEGPLDKGELVNDLGINIKNEYTYTFEIDSIKRKDKKSGEIGIECSHNIIPEVGYLYFVTITGGVARINKYIEQLKADIIDLLKKQKKKISVSDINAFLKHQNIEEIRGLCEEMYHDEEIDFAGNGRYFILDEEDKEPMKSSALKSEKVDVENELEKLKGLLDKDLITQETYDAKVKQLLGL